MFDAQKKLGGVSEAFDLTLKRLKDGRDNLVGRVEEIRRLGAKVNKQLPAVVIEEALIEYSQDQAGSVQNLDGPVT
jgi:DNA recombination protein RmuC